MMSQIDPALRTFIVCHRDWGTLRVTGPERLQWLQGLLTCDVKSLSPGQAVYGLVLTKTGKILSDVTVAVVEDSVFLSTATGRGEVVCEHLDRLLVMEDAEIENVSADHGWLAALGPGAASSACALSSAWPCATLSSEAESAGIVFVVPRPGLQAAAEVLVRLGGAETELLPDAEWDGIRIALGLPRFGVDYDESHTPHQAALEQVAVCWSKGCYVGQEAVYKQGTRGKTRSRLFAIEIAGDELPPPGTPVYAGTEQAVAGSITSAAIDPVSERRLAFARLKTAVVEAKQPLAVMGAPATLAAPDSAP